MKGHDRTPLAAADNVTEQPVTVSLGLPVYNGEEFLEETLRSICAQKFHDFELIISDNASTDNTEAICRDYCAADARLSYYRSDSNQGAAPNYNNAFQLSSGRYFKWIAYDDPIEADFLGRCVDVLDTHPAVVLCFTRAKMINERSEVFAESSYEEDVYNDDPAARFRNIMLALDSVPRVPIPIFGVMRRSVAKKTALIGSYPSSDVVLLAELALYGPFFQINEPLLRWRHHPRQSIKGILASDRDRSVWFNTALSGKVVLPKWNYLLGYVHAIRNAPLENKMKRRCYLSALRWGINLRNLKSLAKDVALAAAAVPARMSRQPERKEITP